jgi:putative ABC transport system permease protein
MRLGDLSPDKLVVEFSALVARLRSLWRGLRRRAEVEAEMSAEFRQHLELRTEDLVRRGLTPAEAARQARIEFGQIDFHKIDARASRGLGPFEQMRFSLLDVKLGARMLAKYPVLSVVSVVGMAVAIAIGAFAFGFISSMLNPRLPLPQDEQLVALENAVTTQPGEERQSVQDFVAWRDELRTVQDLAAFTSASKNLVIPGAAVELVEIAQMTASGFRAAKVPPVLGRPLLDSDESAGAPFVVVIAFEEWQERFGGAADIVGRAVRLGSDVHTVVGVMPEGFRFPINYRYWVPLRLRPTDYEAGGGPSLIVFGRLAAGVTLERAQAELTHIGLQMAAAYPATHERLRPRVLPYAHAFFDLDSPSSLWTYRTFQILISLLLVVVAVNVSTLVYARTATRTGEIAVRTALGASRARVVTQLFAEALVLSVAAALIGLLVGGVGLAKYRQWLRFRLGDEFPYWLDVGLSSALITYVLALAILGALIVGVLPALKATGHRVQASLQQLSSRGSQMQLGRTWTALIIVQVAVAVALLPFAVDVGVQMVAPTFTYTTPYSAEAILRASLSMEREALPRSADTTAYRRAFETRYRLSTAELLRRLEAEPAVAGVAFAREFPGRGESQRIEVEDANSPADARRITRGVLSNRVDTDVFAVFDVPILAGRAFVEADARAGSTAVIVDQLFVEEVLHGGNAVGRRIRYHSSGGGATDEMNVGAWLEIVGVVPDFDPHVDDDARPKVYEPASLDQLPTEITLALRVRGGQTSAFSTRLREIGAAVDATLQLRNVNSVADNYREGKQQRRLLALASVLVILAVLLLSGAGIYAMMSFTVARRRREIGIRSALGANPRRILSSIFARASAQLGIGVLFGLLGAFAVDRLLGRGPVADGRVIMLPIVALLMMTIGLLAAFDPARRGLSVQPTEALREE